MIYQNNNKLPKEDDHGNRLVFSLKVYVSRDGQYVHSASGYTYKINGDENEEPYILINKRKYSVADLVATCYKPKPKDGKEYVLIHIDGDLHNCDKSNLEWKQQTYKFNADPTTKLSNKSISIVLTNKGEVKQGNQTLTQQDYCYDSDTDCHDCIKPYVLINGKRCYMEDLVAEANYVQGDKYSMNDPVILHIDNDRNNYASSNLEWVERTDPRFIKYKTDEKAFIIKRRIELNPGKTLPTTWTI